MKRVLLSLALLVAGISFAADDDITNYAPIYLSSAGTKSGNALIAFNNIPSGTKTRNCITDISVSADNFLPAGFTVTILDGGTTAYQLTQSTMALIESWYPKNPLCLSLNTTTYINMSAGNFKVNATGYEKSR